MEFRRVVFRSRGLPDLSRPRDREVDPGAAQLLGRQLDCFGTVFGFVRLRRAGGSGRTGRFRSAAGNEENRSQNGGRRDVQSSVHFGSSDEWVSGASGAFVRRSISTRRLCRSEEHTSELQSLMRISYAVFCLKKQNSKHIS